MYSKKEMSQLVGIVVKAKLPELKLAHEMVTRLAYDGGEYAVELFKIINFAPMPENSEQEAVYNYLKGAYDAYFVE